MGCLYCSVCTIQIDNQKPKAWELNDFLDNRRSLAGDASARSRDGKDLLLGHWRVGSTDNVLPPCRCTRCFGFHSTGRRSWGSACSRGHRCEAPEHPLQAAALCPSYSVDSTKNSYCQLQLRLEVLFHCPKGLAHTVTYDKFQQFPAEATAVL